MLTTVSPRVELLSMASYMEPLTVVRFSTVPPSMFRVPPSLLMVYRPQP